MDEFQKKVVANNLSKGIDLGGKNVGLCPFFTLNIVQYGLNIKLLKIDISFPARFTENYPIF